MNFFITGCYRSGTTLIANFINSQSGSHALNQPGFNLFVLWKRLFYRREDNDCKKWLGFGTPPVYDPSTFNGFLKEPKLRADELNLILDEYHRILSTNGIGKTDFIPVSTTFYSLYDGLVRQIHDGKPTFEFANILGSKEILCHEFITYLMSNKVKIICVVRNPVDMIVSLNLGEGENYTGGIRPTLLNLRNWREVAQVSLRLLNNKSIFVVRYEDFINDLQTRYDLLKFLGIQDKELSLEKLRDDNGDYWSANTSFTTGEKPILPKNVRRYIESICLVEMKCFGYETTVSRNEATRTIRRFKEPWTISPRDYYEVDYSIKNYNIDYEISILDRSIS